MPSLHTIATGVGLCEGPVVASDGTIFVTSIDHGCVYEARHGSARIVARTGGGANGAVLSADGSLYIAQNGGRWNADGPGWLPASVGGVQRVSPDGEVSWVTRDPIAPNDLCFGPDGLLYLTDPTRAPATSLRTPDARIWRTDPRDGTTELLLSVPWYANGIGFGPDDRLYVAATFTAQIFSYAVTPEGLDDERLVVQMTRGYPDGFAFDADGNIVTVAIALAGSGGIGDIQTWTTTGDLVDVFAPGDSRIYSNVAFGNSRELVITDMTKGQVLLADDWPTPGLPLYPFR